MSDRDRYRGMSDEDLESLIAGLPRRAPGEEVRRRVLGLRTPAPRSGLWARPAFALMVLLVLCVADALVMHRQGLVLSTHQRAQAAQPVAADNTGQDDWLVELAREDGGLRAHLMLAVREPQGSSYWQLRTDLLAGKEAG